MAFMIYYVSNASRTPPERFKRHFTAPYSQNWDLPRGQLTRGTLGVIKNTPV